MTEQICYFLVDGDSVVGKSYQDTDGWVPGSDHVAPGYLYKNGEFIAPTPLDIDMEYLRTQQVIANNAQYDQSISALTLDYPAAEISTWERQRAEAVAWGADPAAATPWIDIAASARGLDRDEYLSRTLAKVTAFAGASAYLTGRRQGIDDQIRAATTAEQLAAVVIDYTLPGV